MAIVFIQSKKRQKIFLWIIIMVTVLILSVIPLIIFSPWFSGKAQNLVYDGISKPDININLKNIDLDQVKNLEPFLDILTEFTYTAKNKNGKQIVGKISAVNKDDAKNILIATGLKVSSLEESTTGRKEPFAPYYQSTVQKVPVK